MANTWFVPEATVLETESWKFPGAPGIKHKVGRWPHPNTNRVDARFILRTTTNLAHSAYRRLFAWDMRQTTDATNFPDFLRWGEWDLLVAVEGTISATSDTNVFGWVASIEIKEFTTLAVDGGPGVQMILRADHAISGHFNEHIYEFPEDSKQWFYDRDIASDFGGWVTENESVGFPYDTAISLDYAMSDCFRFPRPDLPDDTFAEFNDDDANIHFDAHTNLTGSRHKTEADIRINTIENIAFMGRTNNSTKYNLLTNLLFSWRSSLVVFTTPIPLGVWGRIRIEFNWSQPGTQWKIWWNDVLIGEDAVFGSFNNTFNCFGRRASTIEGDFDMKNFSLLGGTPAIPVEMWICELINDACDTGEKSLKGTTVAMTLPSCP